MKIYAMTNSQFVMFTEDFGGSFTGFVVEKSSNGWNAVGKESFYDKQKIKTVVVA